MQTVKIEAISRKAQGKGEARRLRRENKIPAVAYGGGKAAVAIAVSPKALLGVLASDHGRNSVIELAVEGGEAMTVLLSEYQYHPLSRALLHADFYQIALDEIVEVEVPLELTGKPQGVILGGTLRQVFRRLPISCLPKDIPVKIVHDMTAVELEQAVSVSELALPEGVVVRLPAEQTVAAVVSDTRRPEAEEEKPADAKVDPKAGDKDKKPEAKN